MKTAIASRRSTSTKLFALASLFAVTACGRPFDVKTPKGFVELEKQDPAYDYRATTADGVVVAARAIDAAGRNDLGFWTEAVTLQVRDELGYALLASKDVKSGDGSSGRELDFGHDQDGAPYAYRVTLFAAQDRVFVLEAGGTRDALARMGPELDLRVSTFRARCGFFLAPVFASRTCNRW
jgi:hypothetical protein